MKTERFVLATAETPARYATQVRIGVPALTPNKNLRYSFESREQAERQRPLYERALDVTLAILTV